jgi:hypothetical protein
VGRGVGGGGASSDDWTESLALCILCGPVPTCKTKAYKQQPMKEKNPMILANSAGIYRFPKSSAFNFLIVIVSINLSL